MTDTKAENDIEDAIDIDELFYEGSDLHGEGKHEEAMACFERCLDIDPDYVDALLGKAMVHLSQKRFDEAIVCGKRIVELTPDDVLAHTNLSVFYQRAGMIPEAEEAAAKAKVLDWKRQIGGGRT